MGHRLTVAQYFINQGYSVCKVLHYCNVHRTTWYRYRARRNDVTIIKNPGRPAPGYSYDKFHNKIEDSQILSAIKTIRNDAYTSLSGGYKKLKYYLHKDLGVIINHKKVYRLCKENNLLLPRKFKSKQTRQISINRIVSDVNQRLGI